MKHTEQQLNEWARQARITALKCVYHKSASHIGSGFSCADLLIYLYREYLTISPAFLQDPQRDRFILSKGHAAAVYYAVLAGAGFFPEKDLEQYCEFGSMLAGHVHHAVAGVELSTGSLGHALPVGVGMALALKRAGSGGRVVILMSDGEMQEGSNWEALNLAAAHGLDNLIGVIDLNGLQAMGRTRDILPMENLSERLQSFGAAVREIDGHDFRQMDMAFSHVPFESQRPSMIIARTVKGKGVSFMEDALAWHYKSPDEAQFQQALRELEAVR